MTPEEMRADAESTANEAIEISHLVGNDDSKQILAMIGALSAQEMATTAEICERLDTIIELMNKLVAAAPARVYTAPSADSSTGEGQDG